MAIPRMTKVVVNIGEGEAAQNIKLLDAAMDELGRITGQKPLMRRAKKSVAAFKIREGNPVGCSVTLRGQRMYEFIDRLFNIALPRVRDFRGVPNASFDGRGNYTMGLGDQLVFPRNRLFPGGAIPGHEHNLLHHGERRPRRPKASRITGNAFPALARSKERVRSEQAWPKSHR